jgi:hypothetical protein
MLGAEQREWLRRGLAASDASFKLLLTTMPLDYGRSPDGWHSFATERDGIVELIRERRIRGVVALSADRHWFAAYRHASGMREFQVGPLQRDIPELPPAGPETIARAGVFNYGEVLITPGDPPTLTFTARDQHGAAIYTETLEPWLLPLRG